MTGAPTAWRCTGCGDPVQLRLAREHFNACEPIVRDPEPDDDDDDDDDPDQHDRHDRDHARPRPGGTP